MHTTLPLPHFLAMDIHVAPLLIPIVAIVMGLGLAMLAVVVNYRKKKELFTLYHQERMAAIDKGVELPPLPEGVFGDEPRPVSPRRNLLTGLIWALAGVFLSVGLFVEDGLESTFFFGLIPVGIGLAFLIYYFAVGRHEAALQDEERKAKLAVTNRPRSV